MAEKCSHTDVVEAWKRECDAWKNKHDHMKSKCEVLMQNKKIEIESLGKIYAALNETERKFGVTIDFTGNVEVRKESDNG